MLEDRPNRLQTSVYFSLNAPTSLMVFNLTLITCNTFFLFGTKFIFSTMSFRARSISPQIKSTACSEERIERKIVSSLNYWMGRSQINSRFERIVIQIKTLIAKNFILQRIILQLPLYSALKWFSKYIMPIFVDDIPLTFHFVIIYRHAIMILLIVVKFIIVPVCSVITLYY